MNGYELVRLQENQVKKTGDTMTGNLTMAGNAEVVGNATSSTKLKDARTFTIGNAQPKSFDGTQNLTWTLQEIGAEVLATDVVMVFLSGVRLHPTKHYNLIRGNAQAAKITPAAGVNFIQNDHFTFEILRAELV